MIPAALLLSSNPLYVVRAVLSEELLRQMRQREQELRQAAARAYSLGASRCAISHQLQLRVVREAGLPDQAATLLAQAPSEDWVPSMQDPLDLMVAARPAASARAPPNPILVPPSRAPPRRLAPPSDLRLHRQPHLGRRALRLAEVRRIVCLRTRILDRNYAPDRTTH